GPRILLGCSRVPADRRGGPIVLCLLYEAYSHRLYANVKFENDATIEFDGKPRHIVVSPFFWTNCSDETRVDTGGAAPATPSLPCLNTGCARRRQMEDPRRSTVGHVLVKEYAIGLANLCRLTIVNEWQEGIAAAACDFGHCVQKRAREHHRA